MLFTAYLFITILLFLVYTVILLLYRKWFKQLKPFSFSNTTEYYTRFSIIIPARNEEQNIRHCLQSITAQQYDVNSFEVIVIDDHSTDNTAKVVSEFAGQYGNITLMKLADEIDGALLNSYKKKAIEKAIGIAKFEWIITTDADCIVQPQWLAAYNAFIQSTNDVFVAAPVIFSNDGSVVQTFQHLDFMTLQGITAAAVNKGFHNMCNGANLAYRKDIFNKVNGFKGIDNIASGDDMLLMNKIRALMPTRVGFLFSKAAIVTTHPMPTWQSFFNQRIRWASKADKLKSKDYKVFFVLMLVYFLNVALFLMPLLSVFNINFLFFWFVSIAFKTIVEAYFILSVAQFFNQPFIWWFPLLQPLHIVYIVISGWLGKFGTYHWKGRTVK
jgi:cellulose synthase/poly-beta-1,6-N-acetylglucosamine synthase-like glycosyltransferase